MRNISRLVLVLIGALNAAAQPAHEKILVPVFFSGPGAHGSDWWTTVAIANSGEKPIRFSREVLEGNQSCPAICGCGPSAVVRPRTVNQICILNADPAGLLLYMENLENPRDAQFGARIFNLSRGGDTAGSELKIVREHELRSINILLPNVPLGPGYRVGLRIFHTRPPTSEVYLRIHAYPDLSPLVEDTILMSNPPDAYEPLPAHPAFAMIGDLAARYPQLLEHGHGLVSIELLLPEPLVSPPQPPSYWAVVTITNNVTQQVTMVTPQ